MNQQSCIQISVLAEILVEGVLTSASSVEQGREAAESLIRPNLSSDDLLASKEALSTAKELLRDLVVLVDCAPADKVLSMLALCAELYGTATQHGPHMTVTIEEQ